MNRSYGTPPTNKPLDQWTDEELRDIVRRDFERNADNLDGSK